MVKDKKKYRADVLLLGGMLLLGFLLGLFLLFTGQKGSRIQVRVAGAVVETFSLAQNRTYTIEGANNGSNLLVIQNGEAWIEEASCPDGLCVGMGKISQHGQSIVCLPNQVVVEVISDSEEPTVDFVGG